MRSERGHFSTLAEPSRTLRGSKRVSTSCRCNSINRKSDTVPFREHPKQVGGDFDFFLFFVSSKGVDEVRSSLLQVWSIV